MIDEELAALVSAARAALEDASGRGVRDEEVSARSAPSPADREPVQDAIPAAAPRPASDWYSLAAADRADALPPAIRLQQIRDEIGDCRRCGLCRERRQIVYGVGDPAARLVVLGEAPGYHEDQQGEPFVGPAGQMLDKMLENVIGLRRDQVYILNAVKCRPPKNRNPEPDELDACRPFLDAQLAAIAPKLILVLGSVAYRALFRTDSGISRGRGRWHDHEGIPVMPTFHPAYLLRKPEDKKYTFEDLKAVKQRYEELGLT
ncbi:MAG: uracil-DNA glycosylase [Myxococcota bacterium]